jgi:hypothetical protein
MHAAFAYLPFDFKENIRCTQVNTCYVCFGRHANLHCSKLYILMYALFSYQKQDVFIDQLKNVIWFRNMTTTFHVQWFWRTRVWSKTCAVFVLMKYNKTCISRHGRWECENCVSHFFMMINTLLGVILPYLTYRLGAYLNELAALMLNRSWTGLTLFDESKPKISLLCPTIYMPFKRMLISCFSRQTVYYYL